MTELARALLHDLAAASEHLLDEGLAAQSGSGPADRGLRGPIAITLRLAHALLLVAPRALRELEEHPSVDRESVTYVREPRRASPSRRPYDYVEEGGVLAPILWECRQPELELPRSPLSWLLHGTQELVQRMDWHRELLESSRSEAIRFRSGSQFGQEELVLLASRRSALEDATTRTQALAGTLKRMGPPGIRPSPRRPRRLPDTPAWRAVRFVLHSVSDPIRTLPALAADLNDPDPSGVDLAFLYQRWCGWKTVQALELLGFRPTSDPVPALLLAGAVELRSGDRLLTLLCEPRLTSRKRPLHGLFVTRGEASPDLVLVGDATMERRVYVLDPTLSRSPDSHQDKAKYLHTLRVNRQHMVAGVLLRSTGPDRAWAAAPLRGGASRPGDWRGTQGVVPMDPIDYDDQGLLAWLADLIAGPSS